MKKINLVLFSMCISTALLAQQKTTFGLKAGLNLANWKVQNQSDVYGTRTGFHIGGLAHIHLNNKIGFQPELLFSSQGAENKGANIEYRTRYMNVPLMLQYMFHNGFRVEAGPQIGFLVSADRKLSNGNEENTKVFYKKTDVGLGFGLNYLTYSGLGIGGRYNLGLSNINENTTSIKTMNRVGQISVFYMFNNRKAMSGR